MARTGPQKRNRLHIVHDILAVAEAGARRTHILYRANLSFARLDSYLDQLLTDGLLSEGVDRVYTTTEKGERFLRAYDTLQEARQAVVTSERQMLAMLERPNPEYLSGSR